MRTKSLEGWKRKPDQLTILAGACGMKVKKQYGVLLLLAVGMVLLTGAPMMRMHLLDSHDVTPQLGNDRGITARLPGTINHDFFHCDRSQFRTDICNLRGDIRMEAHNKSKSFVLYAQDAEERMEKLKPYTRKWEEGSMSTVNEVMLTSQIASPNRRLPKCDVHHKVPGVIFSTGGYTGNLYHEFNDGLIPLFITSQHLRREVVVIISSFHDWWYTKYQDVVGQISKYKLIDLDSDKRVHCFPEIEAGLHIHGELCVNPNRMPNRETIGDFRELLNRAYKPASPREEAQISQKYQDQKLRLTIIVRKKTRKFMNLDKIVQLGEQLRFKVNLLSPGPATELKKIYWLLNNTDVLLGVHGAAMTHFLFMRPGTVLIQVVPLGTDWAANEYYGEPAVKLGLRYLPYKIIPEESSLSDKHNATDPVLVDPDSITQQGWESVKKIYLEGQDVRPSLPRMREVLTQAKSAVKESSKPRADRQ
ncbi:hypothetical protein KC19_6G091100 [Ceratodon purpureus]|uniref:Glycosyltransferase 61 catalytic domain-containing protein n=1 Tax=Ceratodon purpureus TaxID=3225 RepID=A0A8T0HIJ3_CERPU|nr:hypothetical protein KC19_6G091100 [Ceratodon purpureus]